MKNCESNEDCDGSGSSKSGSTTSSHCLMTKTFSQQNFKKLRTKKVKFKLNIITGETSQAITPFHFFDYFNFSNFYQ